MRSFVAALVVLACTLISSQAAAQVTTANLRGTVQSADDQLPMAEVEVTLLHVPSGNRQTATSSSDGAYAFTNLRVGGPYIVRAESIGFQPFLLENVPTSEPLKSLVPDLVTMLTLPPRNLP